MSAAASSNPVPVPVVNEVVEKVARLAWIEACEGGYEPWDEMPRVRRDFWKGVARAMLDVPEVAAAFEAQAKLEAERAEVDRLREALFGLLVFARGNPVVLAKIHGALDGRVEEGGELS